MGGLDEPQAPILDIRNSSTPELKFEQIRVVCGAHQNRLFFEGDAFFSLHKYLLADRRNLGILVGTPDQTGAHSSLPVRGAKHYGESLWSFGSHSVCHVKNMLARSVVGAENHRPRSRKELFEIQDVAGFRSTERVDRLCIVSDDRDPFVGSSQRLQNIYLQSVHVLVLIDQYVVEGTSKP